MNANTVPMSVLCTGSARLALTRACVGLSFALWGNVSQGQDAAPWLAQKPPSAKQVFKTPYAVLEFLDMRIEPGLVQRITITSEGKGKLTMDHESMLDTTTNPGTDKAITRFDLAAAKGGYRVLGQKARYRCRGATPEAWQDDKGQCVVTSRS